MRSGVLYINKRQFINTLCASAIAVVMSACSHTYPPSRYIGIFDSYDGYKNGELPFNGNYLYSGTWSTSYPRSKQIRVQGSYYKGKPDGKWKSFYRNGDLQFFAIYSNGQKEQMVSYYPDGVPNSISQSDKKIEYYPDGRLYVRSNEKKISEEFVWNPFLLLNAPIQMSHFYELDQTSVYVFLYPEANNYLNLWCYIVSSKGISKIKISTILSNETGTLKNIEYDIIYGKIKALLSSSVKNKILKITLSLRNEQIRNARLLIDIPLSNLKESSPYDEFISYSFQ